MTGSPDIAAKMRKMRKRYVASKRHTIQVDYDDYMRDLDKELEAGRDRADRRAELSAATPVSAGVPA